VKHLKPTQQNQRGGRIQKEAPIHISEGTSSGDPKTGKARGEVHVASGEKASHRRENRHRPGRCQQGLRI